MDVDLSQLESENLEKEQEDALRQMLAEDREKNWIPDNVLFLRSSNKKEQGPWYTFPLRGNAPEKNRQTAKSWAGNDSFLTRANVPRLGYRVLGEIVRHKSSSPVWKVISPDNEIFDMKSVDVWPIILGPGIGPNGEIMVPLVWGQTSTGIRLMWSQSRLGELLVSQQEKERLERQKSRDSAAARRETKKENPISLTLLSEWCLKDVGHVLYTGRREFGGKKWYSFMTTHGLFEINSHFDSRDAINYSNYSRAGSARYIKKLKALGLEGESLYLFREVPSLEVSNHDYACYYRNLSDPKHIRNADLETSSFYDGKAWQNIRVEKDRAALLLQKISNDGSTPEEWCQYVLPSCVNMVFTGKNKLELVRSVTSDVAKSRKDLAFGKLPCGIENYDSLSQWRHWTNVKENNKQNYTWATTSLYNTRMWLLGIDSENYYEWSYEVIDPELIAQFPVFISK